MHSAIVGRFLTILLAGFLVLLVTPFAHASTILAVIAPRGAEEAQTRWAELVAYLSEKLHEPFLVRPISPECQGCILSRGDVDLVLTHSAHTVALVQEYDAIPLATIDTGAGPRFGGVIVARADSKIATLADLRGKHVGCMKINESSGAYIFQSYELAKINIDPHKDFASLAEAKTQDDLVRDVIGGHLDAAFVRTGLLEALAAEGKIKLAEIKVINAKSHAGFPYLVSTDLYPEWYISALPHLPEDKRRSIGSLLLSLPSDAHSLTSAHVKQFVAPVPSDKMRDAMKLLRIPPFEQP